MKKPVVGVGGRQGQLWPGPFAGTLRVVSTMASVSPRLVDLSLGVSGRFAKVFVFVAFSSCVWEEICCLK